MVLPTEWCQMGKKYYQVVNKWHQILIKTHLKECTEQQDKQKCKGEEREIPIPTREQ